MFLTCGLAPAAPTACLTHHCISFAGIGTLLGAWLVQQAGVQPALLGRSGRFAAAQPAPRLQQQLLQSEALVVAGRCDVAAAEEAAAVLANSCSCQPAAIVHAGGVLQDAALTNQTAAGLRAVCAPKVPFAARSSLAAGLQALRAVNLFSSVAACVGTAGQANYAAANSALDCWAEVLQGHGVPGIPKGVGGRWTRQSSYCHALGGSIIAPPIPHASQEPASSGEPGRALAWRTPPHPCWHEQSRPAWGWSRLAEAWKP